MMKNTGRIFLITAALLVSQQVYSAEQSSWIVATEGLAPLDLSVQIPSANIKRAYVLSLQQYNKFTQSNDARVGRLGIKFFQPQMHNFKPYVEVGATADFMQAPASLFPFYTLGYGGESSLGKYFVLDAMLGLAYDTELQGTTFTYRLALGYRF